MTLDDRLFSRSKFILAVSILLLHCGSLTLIAAPQNRGGWLISSKRIIQETGQNQDQVQTDQTPPTRDTVTLQLIDEELAKVEKAELDENDKTAILKHYLAARRFLTSANTDQAAAAQFRDQVQNVLTTREQLRIEIEKLESLDGVIERPQGGLAELEQRKQTLEKEAGDNQRNLKLTTDEPARRLSLIHI